MKKAIFSFMLFLMAFVSFGSVNASTPMVKQGQTTAYCPNDPNDCNTCGVRG